MVFQFDGVDQKRLEMLSLSALADRLSQCNFRTSVCA